MNKVRGLLYFAFALACAAVVLAYGFTKSVSLDVWIPEQHSMVNVALDDASHYGIVKEVSLSGTAVYLPLDQFRKAFGSASVEMIIDESAQVWYLTKKDGHLYVAKTRPEGSWFVKTATSFGLGRDSLTLTLSTGWVLVVLLGIMSVLLTFRGREVWIK